MATQQKTESGGMFGEFFRSEVSGAIILIGCTVAALIDALGFQTRRIAIAVNRDVVPRSAFATHQLAADDRVEILEAVGGG